MMNEATGNRMVIDGQEFLKDAQGRWVCVANISKITLVRDGLVRELTDKAEQIAQELQRFFAKAFADLDAFREVSAEEHCAAVGGGKRGGFSLQSFDGTLKVVYDVDAVISFNEKVSVAREIILRLVEQWTEKAGADNAKLASLVRSAFETDKDGHLSVAKIMQLRRTKIDDAEWKEAMAALGEGIETNQTRLYVRFYRKDENGKWEQIALGR